MRLVHLSIFTHHWCMAKALSHDASEWKDIPMPRNPRPTAASRGNTVTETAEDGANKRPLICHVYTLKSLSSKNFWKQHCLYGANEKGTQGDTMIYCSNQESRCLQDLGTHLVHPSPKTGSVIPHQSGRCLYSLTLTSLLSQGFHTLQASLFWGYNLLPRKKLFPTPNLKHCYIFSPLFLFPSPMDMKNRLFSLFCSSFLHATTMFSHQSSLALCWNMWAWPAVAFLSLFTMDLTSMWRSIYMVSSSTERQYATCGTNHTNRTEDVDDQRGHWKAV